tara:strand:+ start:171 stop:380 length:210 start_codon:yes stop_codon:yes gene_type:complete
MRKQTIKFSIKQDGTVTEEVTGVEGTSCIDLTEEIENKLGHVKWTKESTDYYKLPLEENVTLQHNQDHN